MNEKQQWAQWKQKQTLSQLQAFKDDVKSPVKSQVRSGDILSSQKLGSSQITEDMLKGGVMSKFARRKLQQEQESSGIISEASSHGGANGSFGPAAKFDCYNEVGWLKTAVRKLEDQNKQLIAERNVLLKEKTSWHAKFQEENKHWMEIIGDVRIAKTKLKTEIADFIHQRNALRTVEVCAADRQLYDKCLHQFPIPNGMDAITSGNQKLRATELHALLTGLVASTCQSQSRFLEQFTTTIADIETSFMHSLSTGSASTVDSAQTRLHQQQQQQHQLALTEHVKQWSKNCEELSNALITHTRAGSSTKPGVLTHPHSQSSGGREHGVVENDAVHKLLRANDEMTQLRATDVELRQTITLLRNKNAELTRQLRERSQKSPGSPGSAPIRRKPNQVIGHASNAGVSAYVNNNRQNAQNGNATSSEVSQIDAMDEEATESTYQQQNDTDDQSNAYTEQQQVQPSHPLVVEEEEVEVDQDDHHDWLADVPVQLPHEGAAEYQGRYSHIQEVLAMVQSDIQATPRATPLSDEFITVDDIREHARRLKRVNTREFRLVLEDELHSAAEPHNSAEFESLFPTLAVKSPSDDHQHREQSLALPVSTQSPGRQLFIDTLMDPSNRLYHDTLKLYLQDVVLEHPLLIALQTTADVDIGDQIITVLYDEISLIVTQQICDVVVATLADSDGGDISLAENEMKHELLANQYLRNSLLPNQQLLNNFITLALHSVTVHPEINALVTMAVSFCYENQRIGGQ